MAFGCVIPPVDQYGQGCGSSTAQYCPQTPEHLVFFCYSFQVHIAFLQNPKNIRCCKRSDLDSQWKIKQKISGKTDFKSTDLPATIIWHVTFGTIGPNKLGVNYKQDIFTVYEQ